MCMSRRREMPMWLRMILVIFAGLISAPILLLIGGVAISQVDLSRIDGTVPLINGYRLHQSPRVISANRSIAVPDSRVLRFEPIEYCSLEVGMLAVYDQYVVGTLYHYAPQRASVHGTVAGWFILDTERHATIKYDSTGAWNDGLRALGIDPAAIELRSRP